MAGLRRAQDIDQWRPEETSIRDSRDRERERDRPRDRAIDSRAVSPVPRAARDDRRRDTHDDDDTRSSAKHVRERSRERSLSKDRTRRRSRGDSREDDRYRPSRGRAAVSPDKVSHARHHEHHRHHHHHRDTSPSPKRRRTRSPSRDRDSHRRTKRKSSRSSYRSPSRSRHTDTAHRPAERNHSQRPSRSDRERPARRLSPASHIPPLSSRRRSPSEESRYRTVSHRGRKRSQSADRRSRREETPRRHSPTRHHRRHRTPSVEDRERARKRKDKARSRSHSHSHIRHAHSKSPRRKRSPSLIRRRSPHRTHSERESPRRDSSSRKPLRNRRPSLSRSPPPKTKRTNTSDKEHANNKSAGGNHTTSRRASPLPESGYTSDTRSKEGEETMRGAYHQQGRPQRPGLDTHSNYHSPSYTANQFSPQGQSPYQGGRGSYGGHQNYPAQGSPVHGYSPNQSPFQQNSHNYSPHGQYNNQPYQGSAAQTGYPTSPYRGGFRGNHISGPDRRLSGPSSTPAYTAAPVGRGRGGGTQFSNLSWTPSSGTRGGRQATEAPRYTAATVPGKLTSTSESSTSAVDADDNPFRPSKEMRVEDEGSKEEKKMPPPTSKPATASSQPKGFSFSLKTKVSLPTTSSQTIVSEAPPKEKESVLEAKTKTPPRENSSRYTESRTDRDREPERPRDRDYDREHDRERDRERDRDRGRDYRERDRRYDTYDKQHSTFYERRDPRDVRDSRDSRDARPRDPRDSRDTRERDIRDTRDPRERDPRDIRDIRDARERDPRDIRDVRDRDPRDVRDDRDSIYYRDRERDRERDYREGRDARDLRDPRDTRDIRDSRDSRDLRNPRELQDSRDVREARDTRDIRDSRDTRDTRDYRDRDRREPYPSRRPDTRVDNRPDSRPDSRNERREPQPDTPKTKIIKKTRVKPRPTLPPEFLTSDSVYYRKPGNESVVGSGTYGKVFKAIHVYTKDEVALKKIRMEGERDGFPVTAIREVKLLQSLNHENVVKLREVMVEKNDCYMVFEYLSHDLTGLLNHPTFKLDQAMKKDLAKQLFEGLDYLHRRGVLHRDIKAANILVSNTGQLKLADFGLARFYAKRSKLDYTNRVITIWYRSPELLLGETQYGPAVDIWSAACVLVEIFTRHAIFPGDGGEINQLDKIYNVLGTPTVQDWPGIIDMQWFELLRPTERKTSTFAEKYKDRVTPAAFELLSAMFLFDPIARPSASDVLEHPYFASEAPAPRRAEALKELEGDWHEFESKALRKEKEKQDKEARRAAAKEREGEKRRAEEGASGEREVKRVKTDDT